MSAVAIDLNVIGCTAPDRKWGSNLTSLICSKSISGLTGAPLTQQRFIVDGIYLTDIHSGETLINAAHPEDIPRQPIVILQTSVREDGAGKQWLLDRAKLLAKATNLVEGDLNDPCKYLLLFVFARSA